MAESIVAHALRIFLGDLDEVVFTAVEAACELQTFKSGQILFRQGEPGDNMYLVVSGRLRLVVDNPGEEPRTISEVVVGESISEFGILSTQPRPMSAYAVRNTRVLRLDRMGLLGLIHRHPEIMIAIARRFAQQRQRALGIGPPRMPTAQVRVLLPVSADVPVLDIAERLAQEMRRFGQVRVLDRTRFETQYGREGAADARFNEAEGAAVDDWLMREEERCQVILYVADVHWSNWTQRCVNQSDRLLLVAQSRDNPRPCAIEEGLARYLGDERFYRPRMELLLLHPPGTLRPVGTARWLNQRQLASWYHIRLNEDSHWQRAARRLTGHAVGLALSGGSALGYIHIGVFRALEESGVPVDIVGGTSMGALLGGLYATGWTIEQTGRAAMQFGRSDQLFDFTLPFTSLFASMKVTNMYRKLFGEQQIEDLWRPFFCVSCNATEAEAFVHRQGLLWRSVRASTAIPGVFSPILEKGEVLIDGGVVNNFPVDLVYEACEGGTIIGSTTWKQREEKPDYDYEAGVSGWQIMWHRINPFLKPLPIPTLGEIMTRALTCHSLRHSQEAAALADILIAPDLQRFAGANFANHVAITAAGYEEARRVLGGRLAELSYRISGI